MIRCSAAGIFAAALAALVFGACSTGGTEPETAVKRCKDPRPEVCTREYVPVCGRLAGGARKTYGNACTACSDRQVMDYTPGECD